MGRKPPLPWVTYRAGRYRLACPDCASLIVQAGQDVDEVSHDLDIYPGYERGILEFKILCLDCGFEWRTQPGGDFQTFTALPIYEAAENERLEAMSSPLTWAEIY